MDEAAELRAASVAVTDFITWTQWALARVGFRPSNCLAIVDVCRDELMGEFSDAVTRAWGTPFEVGALGALVFAGPTGMRAALSHVPGEDGRHRFVVFAFSHVGLDADGGVGRVQRRGMHRESTACGALVAFRDQLLDGQTAFTPDLEDVEQSLLRTRLARLLPLGEVPSLVELADMARRAAVADLRRYIELASEDEPVDVAYLSGIVVHGPDGRDAVVRVEGSVTIDGVERHLPH
jgi:hypothetical protein